MVRMSRQISRLLLCAGFLMAVTNAVCAQSAASYPNKPVRVIVPYPPGGGSDFTARIVFNGLTRIMGQPFIIDNRAGGETIIGVNAVAKATPDGYTLLVISDVLLANHWMMPGLPYDASKDFTLVAPLARSESGLLVHPSVPADNLKGFVGYAKANPDKLNVAIGSPLNMLSFQRFMNATGTRFTVVNYKGAGPSIADLVAGNVQVFISNLAAARPLIKSGKVRSFAVSGGKRDPELPDVPTFDEGGVKGFEPSGPLQNMLLAPGKTPRDIVEKLNAQAARALADPEVIRAMAKLGINPAPMNVAAAEKTFRTELERFGQLVKDAGLRPGAK